MDSIIGDAKVVPVSLRSPLNEIVVWAFTLFSLVEQTEFTLPLDFGILKVCGETSILGKRIVPQPASRF
jgi:hypothetical protein